jgi:YHS domain-containing protein
MNPRRNRLKHGIRTAMVLLLLLARAGVSLAQHEGHQVAGAPTGDGACIAHAKESLRVLESANRRLEEARQTNSPQRMRAAMDELQGALGQLKTHLLLCAEAVSGAQMDEGMQGTDHSAMPGMQGMDHSGTAVTGTNNSKMSMPDIAPPPKSPAPPGKRTEMDHSQMDMDQSKMSMPGMNAPAKKADPASASPEGKEMSQVSPQTNTKDPVCGTEVGTRATEKATYQGKTYYFCSRADREKFLSDPARYVNR